MRFISRRTHPTPSAPTLSFEVSHTAAKSNASILKEADYDVSNLIAAHPDSILSYGSEFRNPTLLHPLLRKHPLWSFLRHTLEHGAEFTFTANPVEEDRMTENTALIEYGNHKSAKEKADVKANNLLSEITYGFALVIPTTVINMIKHSMVVPIHDGL